MTERIGNVLLDETYYSGADLYCDGDVEDTLLSIAQNHEREEFPRIIEEQASWPVLYHLSRFRENIVNWLPVTKDMKVLEIGSGCGAVTGALARRAGSVTCVDLSKKRSMINAYRHKDMDNITIRIGNFKDIEPSLDEDYDYVFLIGVFEYGQGYIGTETPYPDFMRIIRRHCAADGRIVIAIENKYGLKYFAGCKEDHVGEYFAGIEDYPGGGGVRTFGRDGLIRIMEQCGIGNYHFYYPYPDYKFMKSIYSDKYLPRVGELTNNLCNFDRERMVLFDEKNVYDGLIREGEYARFSNSFLVVIGDEPEQVYAKFSNDRAPQYAIRTEICAGPHGGRYVGKHPDTPEASAHVKALLKISGKLSAKYEGSGLAVNVCGPAGDGVRFAFVHGETLEEALDECLYRNDEEGFCALLSRYEKIAMYREEEPVSDYDLIFSNILIDCGEAGAESADWRKKLDAEWTLIDYEWTMDGATGGARLAKRAMFVYASGPEVRRRFLFGRGIAQRFGITPENLDRLQREEEKFQHRVTGGQYSMAELYDRMGQQATPVQELVRAEQAMARVRKFQVYEDDGNGFSEGKSYFPKNVYVERDRVRLRIFFGPEMMALRLDPALMPCVLYDVRICINGRCVYERKPGSRGAACAQDCAVGMNGIEAQGGAMVFLTGDPNLTVDLRELKLLAENELTMTAGIVLMPEDAAKSLYPGQPEPLPESAPKKKAFWRRG